MAAVRWYWHELGPTMRKTFKCDLCRRPARWGKRAHARGRSEHMLCAAHAKADPDWRTEDR